MSTLTRTVRRVWRRHTGMDITASLAPARQWIVDVEFPIAEVDRVQMQLSDIMETMTVAGDLAASVTFVVDATRREIAERHGRRLVERVGVTCLDAWAVPR
jgi:hypothetical protein